MLINLTLNGCDYIAVHDFEKMPCVGDNITTQGVSFRVTKTPVHFQGELLPIVGVERVTEPTIKCIQEERLKCEREIMKLLDAFVLKTGCSPVGCDIIHQSPGHDASGVAKVTLLVKVP